MIKENKIYIKTYCKPRIDPDQGLLIGLIIVDTLMQ